LKQDASQGQRLIAGEEAQVNQGQVQKRENPDIAQAVAWRQRGQLYFNNAALEDIVREFNQQGDIKVWLEGIEPGIYRFGGTFNVEDPMSLADILEQQEDLVVERRAGSVVIRAR
jgi:ferric-dicitrate binding protein FerR (iron transport regulator)